MNIKKTTLLRDQMLLLGRIVTGFSRVRRAPRYPDGERESDVEHSFHLALSATELAADLYPDLDIGLVSQFSLVHDLPEFYAGDMWTFNTTPEDLVRKKEAEERATHRLLQELPPHTAQLLKRYEEQVEPEARFVRLVDKFMPAIVNMRSQGASTMLQDHGVESLKHIKGKRTEHADALRTMIPEYDDIHALIAAVWEAENEYFFSKDKK